VKWAREAEDGQRAFGIIDDVRMSRDLLAKSDSILERLRGLMGAANRVRLFPELLAGEEQAVRLLNRVSRARLELSKGLDASEQAAVTGEISAVRSRRRQLADSMGQLPVTPAEFGARENQGNRRWDLLSQRLTEQNQAIDRLNAEANGLRLWLRDDPKGRDPKVVASFVAEIESCERDLKIYREEAATLRQQIEVGRIQIGFGDARYQDDAVRRAEFRDIFEREVDLASRGAAGSNADSYAKRMGPALAQARALEDRLVTAFAALEERVNAKTLELQTKVEEERKKIASYKEQIEVLDSEGRELVGRIAQRNVDIVAEKFRNIVLRADVGITEEAWETRELAMDRVRTLQTERAREERLLDDEMKEVLDDAGDAAPAEPSPTK
jgi:hypothetical protein